MCSPTVLVKETLKTRQGRNKAKIRGRVYVLLSIIEGKAEQATRALRNMPGVGYAAYFQDTEGNIFGLMQPDTSAK